MRRPFEPIIAYTATYLTRSDDKMRIISVAEAGLCRYIFGKAWAAPVCADGSQFQIIPLVF